MICASTEDSGQPARQHSVTRIFVVRMKKAWVLSWDQLSRLIWIFAVLLLRRNMSHVSVLLV